MIQYEHKFKATKKCKFYSEGIARVCGVIEIEWVYPLGNMNVLNRCHDHLVG